MSKYFILIGAAGSGKSTIEHEVLKVNNQVKACVSATTRPKRATETGNEYNFMSEEEFINKLGNGDFVETRIYDTEEGIWHYGLEKKTIKDNGKYLVVMDITGLNQLTEYVISKGGSSKDVISIYINASKEEREKRYLNRDDITEKNKAERIRRFEADEHDIIPFSNDCCMTLRNEFADDLGNCVEFIDNLINRFEL